MKDMQNEYLFFRETNSMVEEFMLLGNIAVAEKILDEFPDCALLRRHPSPPANNYEPLMKAAELKVHQSIRLFEVQLINHTVCF